jgi:putative endonuclease
MFYTYVLKSKNRNWIYVGFTANLKNRFLKHNLGLVQSTKHYRPFELVFYEAFKSKNDARRRELCFKTNKGKRALKLILRESLN